MVRDVAYGCGDGRCAMTPECPTCECLKVALEESLAEVERLTRERNGWQKRCIAHAEVREESEAEVERLREKVRSLRGLCKDAAQPPRCGCCDMALEWDGLYDPDMERWFCGFECNENAMREVRDEPEEVDKAVQEALEREWAHQERWDRMRRRWESLGHDDRQAVIDRFAAFLEGDDDES